MQRKGYPEKEGEGSGLGFPVGGQNILGLGPLKLLVGVVEWKRVDNSLKTENWSVFQKRKHHHFDLMLEEERDQK